MLKNKIKVLLVNTQHWGGAATACIRLHNGLLEEGEVHSALLLKKEDIHYQQIPLISRNVHTLAKTFKFKLRGLFRNLKPLSKIVNPYQYYLAGKPQDLYPFTFPYAEYDITRSQAYQEADIIHLHWVANFLDWESFFHKNNKPIVWTLHDMNPFSGGCHHSLACHQYTHTCKLCPQLRGTVDETYAAKMLQVKLEALQKVKNLHVVAPSAWLMERSKESKLFGKYPHYHIPNALNTQHYQALDTQEAKNILNLPTDKTILCFVAGNNEKLKGFEYLYQAYQSLKVKYPDLHICAIGQEYFHKSPKDSITFFGKIHDEYQMRAVYSASDVLVVPSLAENLPNIIMEALSCGTPVIGFPIGGIPEMIENQKNGLLCAEASPNALVTSLETFLQNPSIFDRKEIAQHAKSKYALYLQAQAYTQLYQDILVNAHKSTKI